MYVYDQFDRTFVRDRIVEFSDQVDRLVFSSVVPDRSDDHVSGLHFLVVSAGL